VGLRFVLCLVASFTLHGGGAFRSLISRLSSIVPNSFENVLMGVGSSSPKNSVSYGCSSHTNSRDVFCTQRGTTERTRVESKVVSGIKERLLDDSVVGEVAREIRRRDRRDTKPSAPTTKKSITGIDRQIGNVVDSLTAVGWSEALKSRLGDLEDEKEQLVARLSIVDSI